jgi:Tol biopolymer transport system component
MGEVYRARDTRLGREVAVKVLPEHLSGNPEIRQRFEREAKAVSSLNHPHICTLFDIGSHEGTDFLVMELLEGETLAVRLKQRPLPLPELLTFGIQIADGLERAHRAGFAHRDLKPGNIMLTRAGAKLLDFGLARSLGESVASGPVSGPGSSPASASPTVARMLTAAPTANSPLTSQGAILGTFQYMAPEQLDGREVDRRTDIFALGLVLYEMATGRRAFEADSQAGLIAEIMKGEPRMPSEIVTNSPSALDRTIRTCIRKDPDDRFQSAHDVRLQLEWIAEAPAAGSVEAVMAGGGAAPGRPKRQRLPWLLAIVAGFFAMAGWVSYNDSRTELAVARQPVAFTISPPRDAAGGVFDSIPQADFSLSPDGRKFAFVTGKTGRGGTLWVRDLGYTEPRMLGSIDDAEMPFWSPDGEQIAFFSQGKLKRVVAEGGPVQVLCDARRMAGVGGHGGTWSSEGVILFGGEAGGGGIMKVSAAGGRPEAITKVSASESRSGFAERARHEWPLFLPDGKRFLFLQFSGRTSERAIFVGSLDGQEPKKLLDTGSKAAMVKPDWLIYVQGSALVAQRFDLDRLEPIGDPAVIVDGIAQSVVPGTADFTVSPEGHIAYRRSNAGWTSQLTWYGRDGTIEGTESGEASYVSVSLSRDGSHISTTKGTGDAFDSTGVGEAPIDIWNIDLGRGVTTRFTSRTNSSDENPVWSPDGKRIAWASHQNGIAAVYIRDASGAGDERLAYASDENPHPIDWSPDGRHLLLHVATVIGDSDLAVLDLDNPDAKAVIWVQSAGDQSQGQFSPDGRWIAYTSDESGRPEILVRPFPSGDGRWQISGEGGSQPRWRADGWELFYVGPDGTLMSAAIMPGATFGASAPESLFRSEILLASFFFYGAQATYDVMPAGNRFIVNREIGGRKDSTGIEVIYNWPRPGGSGE